MLRILLASTLVLAASCKKEREADPRVTVSSSRDATKPIVDEDYRFRIDLPAPGWKLLDRDEVRHISPDASAGAMGPGGAVFGAVIVEAAPGVELEPWTRMIVDGMMLENKEYDLEPAKVEGIEALGFRVRGRLEGVPLVYRGRVLLHQGHSYQIVAWRLENNDEASDSSLDAFLRSFAITEGDVRGRAGAAHVETARGVGWRVEGGVFESAVTGITARPQGDWRIVVGSELAQATPNAEIALAHSAPDVWIAILTEPHVGESRELFAEQTLQTLLTDLPAELADERPSLRFAGRDTAFHLLRGDTPVPFEHLHAVHFEGDLAVQIIASYVSGQREQALAVIPAGLASLGFLEPTAREKLARQLEAEDDPQSAVGESWSIRRGSFRDFASGISWRKPRGFWRLVAGQQARAENPDATLALEAPAWGLYGVLVVEPSEDWSARDYHDTVVAAIDGARTGPETRRLKGATGLVSEIATDDGVFALTYRVLTVVDGSRAAQLILWGQPESMKRYRASVDDAFDALGFSELQPVARSGGRYQDHRVGVALDEPGPGWTFEDETPAGLAPRGSMVRWTTKRSIVGVVSVCAIGEGQDERWFLDFLDQMIRDRSPKLGKPSESEGELAGRPARHLTWKLGLRQRIEAYLLVEGCTFHALLLGGGDKKTLERIRESFVLLD